MFWHLILLLIGALLFFGGLGQEVAIIQYFGVLVALVLLILALIWKRKLALPRGVRLYALFLLAFALSIIWSQDKKASLEYLALFVGGGLFWLSFYNLREELRGGFSWVVIFLGLAFGGLFAIHKFIGGFAIGPQSLFLPNTIFAEHNHLGDFWAPVLVVAGSLLVKDKKWWTWLLVGLGGYFLAISLSRAAYVALAVGILYLFAREGRFAKQKSIFWLFIFLAAALFLFAGTVKTTFFSRPYFMQGLLGFIHNPWGVGVGNFAIVSKDPANQFLGMRGFSGLAHNVVLEFMVGMGLLGIIFIGWLARVTQSVWRNKEPKSLPFAAIFISLGVNFLFDYTYVIPAMLWLWFMSLGLSYDEKISS